jgi:hypothetical protein
LNLLTQYDYEDLLGRQQYHFQWSEDQNRPFSELFSSDETVREVKEKICQRITGLKWTDVKLSIPDMDGFLEDKEKLGSFNIPPWVRMVVSVPKGGAGFTPTGGMKPGVFEVFVKTFDGRTMKVEVDESSTVQELKIKVKGREGVGERNQRIIFEGKELRTLDSKLNEYNVQKYSTLHLVTTVEGGMLS